MAGGSLTKLLTASAEAIGARCPLRHSVMGGGLDFILYLHLHLVFADGGAIAQILAYGRLG